MGVHHFLVDDTIPEDEEVTWAVRRLHLNCSGGLLGIREEHLCQWLHEATQDNTHDATNRKKDFSIVQGAFQNGNLAEEITW